MVRFHWPCDANQSTFVPPGGIEQDEENGVTHVSCEMELAGQNETCPALLTVPANFLEDGSVADVGVVMAHGLDAEDQRGPLFTRLAIHLARKGHVVMRFYCKQKEQRRQRIFERSADSAMTSPYAARGVKKWVFIGQGNGARIASLVGYKNPRPKHGFIFISYPLLDPAPPPPKQKQGVEPPANSIGPLSKLVNTVKAPVLFLCGELDWDCPGGDLKQVAPLLNAAGVASRAEIIPGVDANFRVPGVEAMASEVEDRLVELVEQFLAAVKQGSMEALQGVGTLEDIVPSTRVPPRPVPAPPAVEEDAAADEEGVAEEMEVDPATAAERAVENTQAAAAAAAEAAAEQAVQALDPLQHSATDISVAMMQQQMMLQNVYLQQQMAAAAAAGLPPVMPP